MILRFLSHRLSGIAGWEATIIVVALHFLVSFMVDRISYPVLWKLYWPMRLRKFEQNGELYDKVFKIKQWKQYIPAIGPFDKKHLVERPDKRYFSVYLLENLRADLYHQLMVVVFFVLTFLFPDAFRERLLVWNFLINVPCIMIQRFNRPRIERALQRLTGTKEPELSLFWLPDEEAAAPLYRR